MVEAVKIIGNRRLNGVVNIDGSKNAAVALIPAAILSKGKVVLKNVPHIDDVEKLIELLKYLEVSTLLEGNTLTIDATNIQNKPLLKEQVSKIRASYYFMGALISLFDKVEISSPGGCNIGKRPIDVHEKGFKALGIDIDCQEKIYTLKRKEYQGNIIQLPFVSVGATINAMLAAVGAIGKTIIENAAREPEINEVAELLNKMGGVVIGAGTNRIVIEGVKELHGTEHSIIPDRIEAGTYIIMAAAIGGQVEIRNVNLNHQKALINVLERIRVKYTLGKDSITIYQTDQLTSTKVYTNPYPEFPTDLQQPITTLLTKAVGNSYIQENIYPDRIAHIKELKKMGASSDSINNVIIIKGPSILRGAYISAKDLRGGASLLLAGLMAEGETILTGIGFIKRGYGDFIYKLKALGAEIELIEVTEDELNQMD